MKRRADWTWHNVAQWCLDNGFSFYQSHPDCCECTIDGEYSSGGDSVDEAARKALAKCVAGSNAKRRGIGAHWLPDRYLGTWEGCIGALNDLGYRVQCWPVVKGSGWQPVTTELGAGGTFQRFGEACTEPTLRDLQDACRAAGIEGVPE